MGTNTEVEKAKQSKKFDHLIDLIEKSGDLDRYPEPAAPSFPFASGRRPEPQRWKKGDLQHKKI